MITSFESVVDGVTGPELVTVGQGDEGSLRRNNQQQSRREQGLGLVVREGGRNAIRKSIDGKSYWNFGND